LQGRKDIICIASWFPDDNKPYLAPYDPINNEVEIYLYEDEYYRGDMFGLRRTPHDKV
jgi:hypothetical protein